MSIEHAPQHEHVQHYISLFEQSPKKLQQMSPDEWADAEFHVWGRRFEVPDAAELD